MATSNSRDFILTRDQIIAASLRKLGLLGIGLSPSADQITEASEALNIMQLSWQNENIFLWTQRDSSVTLVANTASYNLGAENLNVEHAYYRDSTGKDTPLTKLSKEEYDNLPEKTQTSSMPIQYYVDNQLANPIMYVWCVPDATGATGTIKYRETIRLQDFDSTSDNPDFPARWYRALVYGLAVELAPEYGIDPSKWIMLAEQLKTTAKIAGYERMDTQFIPSLDLDINYSRL